MNHDDLRDWLRSLDKGERKIVKSEVAKWNNQARKSHGAGSGRPPVLKPCPKCGLVLSSRELAREHKC